MASSRALRDVLRKENGMRKKGSHSEDDIDINRNSKRQHHAHGDMVEDERERKRDDLAKRYHGK